MGLTWVDPAAAGKHEVSAVASPSLTSRADGRPLQRSLGCTDFSAAASPGAGVDNLRVNTFLALLLYALVASILLAFIYTLKSLRLQNRFKRLGALRGRGVDEILKFVGKPSHRTRLDPHREVLEWRRVGFHLALSFTDGVCDGAQDVPAT
jgi:hypothetical protein